MTPSSPIDSPKALNTSTPQALSGRHEIGARLREARERRSLSQAELARRLNLAASTIDALEREDLSALPSPVYVRGYLRQLAVELEIDEAVLQQAYARMASERAPAPRRPALPGEPIRMPRRGRRFPLLLLWIMMVAITVAGFLVQRYLPESWLKTDGPSLPGVASGTPPVSAGMESVPLPPPSPPSEESHSPGDKPASAPSHESMPKEERRTAQPPSSPAATGMLQSPSAPDTPTSDGSATAAEVPPSPVSPASTLELRTGTSSSWMQVKDATGKVLLEETLKPGSTRRVHGQRPLRVVIGNAAATSLMLDGQAVDLSPYTRPSGTAFIANLGG